MKDCVSLLLLLGVILCSLTSASLRPRYLEGSEHSSLPTDVSGMSSAETHLCPSSSVELLREAQNCVFPSPRGRGRTSCHMQEIIEATQKYCLKMDDPENIFCSEDETDDEGSKVVHCWCLFDELNLDTRYCHLYTY